MNKQTKTILMTLSSVLLAGATTLSSAKDIKSFLIPDPASPYVTGTGPCATIEHSGNRRMGDFHIVSITNRVCRPGEVDGHREYIQVNPRGFVTGGMSGNK